MKLIIGSIVAGLFVFAWGFVSHAVLPLGKMGTKEIAADREADVITALKTSLTDRALYYFPMVGHDSTDPITKKAWEDRLAAGPTGVIAYNPTGAKPMSPPQLATEFGLNVLECFVIGLVLLHLAASAGYVTRVLVATAFGVFATLSIDGSYWNWYRFPDDYFVAQIAMTVGGAFLAGLVLAGFCKPRASAERATL
jgi:hypothetical protein